MSALLEIEGLEIRLPVAGGELHAVRGIDADIKWSNTNTCHSIVRLVADSCTDVKVDSEDIVYTNCTPHRYRAGVRREHQVGIELDYIVDVCAGILSRSTKEQRSVSSADHPSGNIENQWIRNTIVVIQGEGHCRASICFCRMTHEQSRCVERSRPTPR